MQLPSDRRLLILAAQALANADGNTYIVLNTARSKTKEHYVIRQYHISMDAAYEERMIYLAQPSTIEPYRVAA